MDGGVVFWENSWHAADSAAGGAWREWKAFLPNLGLVLPVLLRALRLVLGILVAIVVAVNRDGMVLALWKMDQFRLTPSHDCCRRCRQREWERDLPKEE